MMQHEAAAWVDCGVHVASGSRISHQDRNCYDIESIYTHIYARISFIFAITNYYKTFKCENNTVYIEKKLSLRFKWIR